MRIILPVEIYDFRQGWVFRFFPKGPKVYYEPAIISDCFTITSACLIDAISTKRPL